MSWDRIEFMARSTGLDGGLEARVADPLWMLARQWQVSEFRGDDAAQPAAARVVVQSAPLTSLRGASGVPRPLPHSVPLEAMVEATPGPDFGAAGLHASVRATRRLVRALHAAGLGAAVAPLRAAFPARAPDRRVTFAASGAQVAALLARRGLDAAALAAADRAAVGRVIAPALALTDRTRAGRILDEWRAWYRRLDGHAGGLAWDDERLEYSFSLRASAGTDENPVEIALDAPEHPGGHLDWYSFDVASPVVPEASRRQRTHTALPSPVRYPGMPASRWWQFEDGAVHFGDLDAGPADLARLLVAEFATVYSRDWFVLPTVVAVGSLSRVALLQVVDNFGGRTRIHSTAANDAKRTGGARAWRMFELTGDEVGAERPAPWLLVAPTLVGDVDGPVLERVLLARDEGANLAWAVESLVEGPLGRAVDRAEAWHAALPEEPQAEAARLPAPGRSGEAEAWTYRLESPTPPWWIPFLPERIERDRPQVLLRRARMRAWDLHAGSPAASQLGPQGLILDPRRARWLREEEVPREGVRVERLWQFGRWHDGSYHVWLQRRKVPGRGERSSGLRWDLLVPSQPRPPAP